MSTIPTYLHQMSTYQLEAYYRQCQLRIADYQNGSVHHLKAITELAHIQQLLRQRSTTPKPPGL